MNRPAAAVNPGKANRRFIMLAIVLGLLGAILVYVAFSRTKSSSGGLGENSAAVVVARQDIPARTKITAAMVEVRLLSSNVRRWTSRPQLPPQAGRSPLRSRQASERWP